MEIDGTAVDKSWRRSNPAYSPLMKKLIILGGIVIVGGILTIGVWLTSRPGYNSAPYTVVRTDGNFEVRDYPALTVAETTMSESGSGGGFNRLFAFISGQNSNKQKIAMTTPVFMSGSSDNDTMAFVMPSDLDAGKLPKPDDEKVTVKELPPGRFAVLRYSGQRSREQESKTLADLKVWMSAQGIVATSTPIYGYFDPPWTPPLLRRNEVMLRIENQPSTK